MADTFVPFAGVDVDFPKERVSGNLLADVVNDVAYMFVQNADPPNTKQGIQKNKISDGALLIAEKSLASICVVSTNDRLTPGQFSGQQFTLSVDKTHMFVATGKATSDPTSRRLSKIRCSDLVEVAATAFNTTLPEVSQPCLIVTFIIEGTEYVAVVLANATNQTRLEIFNASSMAFIMVSGDPSISNDDCRHMVVGEDVVAGDSKALYILHSNLTESLTTNILKAVFNKEVPSITFSNNGTVFDEEVHSSWDGGGINHTWALFDPSDNTLIVGLSALTDPPNGNHRHYVTKLSTVDASIIWQVPIGENQTELKSAHLWDISTGFLRVISTPEQNSPPLLPWGSSSALVKINTVTGVMDSYKTSLAIAFDFGSTIAQPVGFWYGPGNTYIYYNSNKAGVTNTWGLIYFDGEINLPQPPANPTVGGTGFQLEPIGCILDIQPFAMEVRDLNGILELGPFRFVEQKDSDETSMVTTLILGLTEADTGLTIFVDMENLSTDVDMDTLLDVLGDDIFIDMGEGDDNSDDFTLELLGNDDGSTFPGPPIEFKPEVLQPIEDRGSVKQYSPIGYSFIYHRLRLKATQIDEKFAVKFVDLSGQLTGRLF